MDKYIPSMVTDVMHCSPMSKSLWRRGSVPHVCVGASRTRLSGLECGVAPRLLLYLTTGGKGNWKRKTDVVFLSRLISSLSLFLLVC